MKKSIFKGTLIVGLIAVAISVFALSGLLPKQKENKKNAEVKKEQIVLAKNKETKSEIKQDVITKEIVIDDIENSNVPVYEYVSKVIIEGKWGTGPGEFGTKGVLIEDGKFIPNPLGTATPIYPDSLAVDSKGNIYILDPVNNRIQKFDAYGKYLKSIKVESLGGYIGGIPQKYLGINIVIDSKDNLYYYLVRNPRTKNSKGEVWMFKNDKVAERWEELPSGYLFIDQSKPDNIFIRKYQGEKINGYPVFEIYDLFNTDFHKCFNRHIK